MRRVLKWTGIGCGCLVGGLVALFVVLVGLELAGVGLSRIVPTPTPRPAVAAATAAPTTPPATSAPTATVRPTVEVPTSTPVPTVAPTFTATPVPTAAPTSPPQPAAKPSGPSAEVTAYLSWLQPKTDTAGRSLQEVGTLSQQAGANPRLMADAQWRTRMGVALGFLGTTGKEMQSYPGVVPPEAAKLDEIVKSMGGDLEYISTEYAAGLDQGSAQRITNAVNRMNGIPAKARAATTEVENLKRG